MPRPTIKAKWKNKYVGYSDGDAQGLIDKIEAKGGVCFLMDDYSTTMGGYSEWMGYRLYYLTGSQVKKIAGVTK